MWIGELSDVSGIESGCEDPEEVQDAVFAQLTRSTQHIRATLALPPRAQGGQILGNDEYEALLSESERASYAQLSLYYSFNLRELESLFENCFDTPANAHLMKQIFDTGFFSYLRKADVSTSVKFAALFKLLGDQICAEVVERASLEQVGVTEELLQEIFPLAIPALSIDEYCRLMNFLVGVWQNNFDDDY